MTAVILGTARGIGETSPVLLTAGFTELRQPRPVLGLAGIAAAVTFFLVKSSEPNDIARGFGTAAALMLLVLVLFVVARIDRRPRPGSSSPADRHAGAARSSRQDAERFIGRVLARYQAVPPPVVSASASATAGSFPDPGSPRVDPRVRPAEDRRDQEGPS